MICVWFNTRAPACIASNKNCLPLQGIKFYDPEIVGDTPEAVEYRGLANVLDAAAEHLGYTQGKVCVWVGVGDTPDCTGPCATRDQRWDGHWGGRCVFCDAAARLVRRLALPSWLVTQAVFCAVLCCALLWCAQAILVPDSSSAARWGALDDVVMVSGGEVCVCV